MERSGGAAPTGCYKCGRPGHWSRDCPDSSDRNPNPNPNISSSNNNNNNNNNNPIPPPFPSSGRPPIQKSKQQQQKAPRRSRPKLTPDLLLSSDKGLGHVLRYFPRALKSRGPRHELNDLRHLLGMYAEWHSRLLPYYSFDQFIHKVEQLGTTKRLKVCLRELRDRVADGADPTKLHEKQHNSNYEQDTQGDLDMPSNLQEKAMQNEDTSTLQEDTPEVIWEKVTEETSEMPLDIGSKAVQNEIVDNNVAAGSCNQNQMSEEQKVRMEANRLKALEKAAARSRLTRS